MALPFNLDEFRPRPSMYIANDEYDTIVAYIEGLNAATQYSLLQGFEEWLVPRLDGGTSLAWCEIILNLAFPGVTDARAQLQQTRDHEAAIECLFRNLEEFWSERSTPNGMRTIYLRFQAWLKRQEWYNPASPDWIEET